jgi:hypothetical protein
MIAGPLRFWTAASIAALGVDDVRTYPVRATLSLKAVEDLRSPKACGDHVDGANRRTGKRLAHRFKKTPCEGPRPRTRQGSRPQQPGVEGGTTDTPGSHPPSDRSRQGSRPFLRRALRGGIPDRNRRRPCGASPSARRGKDAPHGGRPGFGYTGERRDDDSAPEGGQVAYYVGLWGNTRGQHGPPGTQAPPKQKSARPSPRPALPSARHEPLPRPGRSRLSSSSGGNISGAFP